MKIGDVVILRSGGPRMTVLQISGENSGVAVVQMGETLKDFPVAALIVAEESSHV